MASRSARNFPARLLYSLCTRSGGPAPPRASAAALLAGNFHIRSFSTGSDAAARLREAKEEWRKGMIVGNDGEGDDCVITAHDEEMSDSFGFGDKRNVSPQAADKENANRPAITGLLDASLASRFLSDPIITDECDQLAKDEFVVQMAQQLLEALQASTVLEDGTFNDSAFEHFTLVMRIWRNKKFNYWFQGLLVEDCVVPDIIEKLSNEVENEQIGERMCRIKADHILSDILQLKRPPATMIRGLLIILLGYWRYKKLPLGLNEKLMRFDGDFGHKVSEEGTEIIESESDMDMSVVDEMSKLEKHAAWLMEHGTPIQILEDEPFIYELANGLKEDSRLFGKAQKCMEPLHIFDPKDDGALFSAKLHCDLAHEVLEDSQFIQLLAGSVKMDFDGRRFLEKYGKRAKLGNEDVLATVKNIVKDPGFYQYKEQIEKNEVRAAVRVFLSILIVHWMYDDVHEKVMVKLDEYAQAELDAKDDAWKATGYDNVEAIICYNTRFAGDLKGLNEALVRVYSNRSYKHVFDEIKIVQFHAEAITRMDQFDVTMEMKPHLYKGVCEYCSPRIHELRA